MAPQEYDVVDTGITFASGAAYGMTTVAVGQPFDTIKTIVQSGKGEGAIAATRRVVAESGIIKGLARLATARPRWHVYAERAVRL